MRQSTHGVSLLIASYYAFVALIFRFFYLHGALQRVNSMVQLAGYSCYSRYRGFKVLQISDLPVIIYKPIVGSSGAMHSYMFLFTVNTSLGRSTIFGLAISSAALINVSQQVGFSSHIFPGMYITVDYLPYLGLYILHGVFPKPWPFRKILRNPLHS